MESSPSLSPDSGVDMVSDFSLLFQEKFQDLYSFLQGFTAGNNNLSRDSLKSMILPAGNNYPRWESVRLLAGNATLRRESLQGILLFGGDSFSRINLQYFVNTSFKKYLYNKIYTARRISLSNKIILVLDIFYLSKK